MNVEKINLKVDYKKANLSSDGCNPILTAITMPFSQEIGFKRRPALIILPGGGYEFCSDREAEPIAAKFLSYGFQTFILRYSTVMKMFPTALIEAAEAVKFVRENAEKYDIDPDKIGVIGFSAGGHLAASLGVHWNKSFITNVTGSLDAHKPNFMVLSYPVITSGEFRHDGSIINILGENPSDEMLELTSLEKHIGQHTPQAFLWHCADDGCVPVENSLLFMSALSREKIPFEAHIFPYGGHGLSLADDSTAMGEWHIKKECTIWSQLAADWINRM